MDVYRVLVGIHDGNQYTQKAAAPIIGVSTTTVFRHKNRLIKFGYLVPILGTDFHERGPNAWLIESREMNSTFPPPVNPNGPTVPAEYHDINCGPGETHIDTFRAHLHGGMQFEVEKIGDREGFYIRDDQKRTSKYISFLESKPYNDKKGSDFYKGKVQIPKFDSVCKVELQESRKSGKAWFRLWPPEVNFTPSQLDKDPHLLTYPQDFFKENVFEILGYIRKHGGWRFKEKNGHPIGNTTGPVSIAWANPYVMRAIPRGISEIGGSGITIDQSTGEREMESTQFKVMHNLATAGERIEELKAADQALQGEISEHKHNCLSMMKEIWGALEEMIEIQKQDMDLKQYKDIKAKVDADKMFQ